MLFASGPHGGMHYMMRLPDIHALLNVKIG